MSQHFHGYYFNWSLLGTELCPLKIHMLNSNPGTSEWDLLWKTGHFKCNQLRWSHTGGVGPLIQYDWCLYKKGNWEINRHTWKTPCGNEGRDWGVAAKAEEDEPRNTSYCQQPPEAGREAGNRFSLTAPRRDQPCQQLDWSWTSP